MVQQTPDCQGDRFGLVAARQPLRCLLDQGNDIRSIDGYDVCHMRPTISQLLI
jgi:hypothetical protein